MKHSRQRRLVSLVRVIAENNQVHVDQFWYTSACEPEKALRAAAQDFLNTLAGRQAFEETSQDFNWGDAIQHVPDRIWRRHSLTLIETKDSITVLVDHDEIFRPKEAM